jgi:hypothetical protein
MAYKVKPFVAQVSSISSSSAVADQMESFIQKEAVDGWEFVSCGNVDTLIQGSNGCFGFGAKPSTSTSIMVLIFMK